MRLNRGEVLAYKFKKYPIKVVIERNLQNDVDTVVDRGMFIEKRIKSEQGHDIKEYLILKKEKQKLPAPDIKHYSKMGNRMNIRLLHAGRDEYYPLVNIDGELTAIFKEPVINKSGEQLLDENEKPLFREVEKPLINTRIMLDSGKIVSTPTKIASKTYNKETFFANELITAQRIFRPKSFWDRYQGPIMMIAIFALSFLLMAVVLKNINEMIKVTSGQNAEISSQNNKLIERIDTILGRSSPPQQTTTTPPPF